MTESEAIKELKIHIEYLKYNWKPHPDYRVLEALNIGIDSLEKQIPKKPNHTLIKHGKHKWHKNQYGEIDDFAWEFEYHNGVICEVCGETVCVLCNPKYDELSDCEEEYWNCPACDKKILYKRSHCICGQKLDWSDTD